MGNDHEVCGSHRSYSRGDVGLRFAAETITAIRRGEEAQDKLPEYAAKRYSPGWQLHDGHHSITMDWKYALSLELTDPGCDFTLLHDFRQRLLAHATGQRFLDTFLAACKA